MEPSTFGIFHALNNEVCLEAHLNARTAAALTQYGGKLLSIPLVIEKVELFDVKETSHYFIYESKK